MIRKTPRKSIRVKKHWRMRHKINGTPERPRLSVFRSTNHIYAQIIDDTVGNTLVACVKKGFENAGGNMTTLTIAESLDKAQTILKGYLQEGDAVLFLNDLPDVY